MKNRLAIIALVALASVAARSAEQIERPFTTAYRYNLHGQVTGTISPDPDGSGELKYLATRITYDRGLVASVESGELQSWPNDDVSPASWEQTHGFARFTVTVYSYDQYGRKTAEQVRRGDTGEIESLVHFSYDDESRVLCRAVRMNKDAFSAVQDACTQGPQGAHGPDRITRFKYDLLGQVVTEQRGVGTALLQTYVTNEYRGRLLLAQTDANGNRTELRYDAYRRLARRVYPSPMFPGMVNERDYEEYTYEPTGHVRTERKRGGQTITYSYDATNRVRIKDLSDNTHSQDVYFDYYPHGAQRFARYGSSSGPGVRDEVDAFGRVRSTLTNTPQATSSTGASWLLLYEYDDNGNRISVTHPDGQRFGYAFDGLNRNCGVAETVVPASCAPGQLIVGVSYRNDGGRKGLLRAAGTTSYSPDGLGRLQRLAQDLPGTVNDLTSEFSYTPSSQVARLTQSNLAYAYLGNANRTGDYARNGLNQVTAVAGLPVKHDANGNLSVDPGLNFSMTYDLENRLVATTGSIEVTSAFKYDPAGRLAQLRVGQSVTDFVYDGSALIGEYQNGALTRRYVHGNLADEPWVEYVGRSVTPESRRFLLSDHQGSIIATTDSTGSDVRKLAYDSFGIPRNTNAGRFGYTGQLWLRELGLSYYKARVYSPVLGRFLQTDPVGYSDGYNLYAYVGNDPLNAVDPSGMSMVPEQEEAPPRAEPINFDSCYLAYSFAEGQALLQEGGFFRDSVFGRALADQLNFIGLVNGGTNPLTGNFLSKQELQNSVGELALNIAFFGTGTVGSTAARTVANPIPNFLARVVPGNRTLTTLGQAGKPDVFVVAADDIAGLNASQLSRRLAIDPYDVFTIVRFRTPGSGVASPVFRTEYPAFLQGGLTRGGAREFTIPNGPIPPGAVREVVRP